ncbi:MAG: tetratricopeptide repeat protein, partial [Abitibacteriaceae bacterium]|nr:tetratricopeptide repeat protein [Abditibacteriaceae bacterium]
MSRMVCGRCGNLTAPKSTYCPHDRWTLFTDIPAPKESEDTSILNVEIPRHAGFLTRRRHESHRAHLQRELHNILGQRVEKLEDELESDTTNFEAHRALGLLSLLENNWERAHAHLERARQLNNHDCQTHINLAIVLAQRGQVQPAIDLLEAARPQWPTSPLVLFNLALVALQARRPQLAIDAADALEHLWFENHALLHYHDQVLTVRGLALLQLNKLTEARAALDAAARHLPPDLHEAPPPEPLVDYVPQDDEDIIYTVTTPEEETEANGVATPAHGQVGEAGGPVSPTTPQLKAATPPASSGQDAVPAATGTGAQTPAVKASATLPPTEPAHHEPLSEADLLEWESKSNQADFLNNLAIAEAAGGDIENAVAHLAAALRIEPGHTRVLNNLGVLAYEQGYYQLALKYLETAKEVEEFVSQPEPATYNHLGVVLSAVGRLEESMEQFQHAGTHERAEFEVFYNLGRAFIEHGKPQKGVEYLRHAYQLNPNHADVHAVLGAAYLMRGRAELLNEALKYLKRSLQLNPHHRIAFADLAMTMMEMDDEDAAHLILRQALKVHPKSTEAIFLIALMTMERGDAEHWAQAGAQFSAALSTQPNLMAGLYNFALCQYLMGFLDAAALQLQQVTKCDPSFAPAYYLIGAGHAVAKRFKEALAAWNSALQYEPGNIDLHANIAYVYYQSGNFKEAIKHYMNAHRIDPAQPDVLGALGVCFAQASRQEKDKREAHTLLQRAITAFQQSLQLNAHSAVTHSNLGLAYYLQNRVEKAIDHWRIVAQIDAGYAERREEEQHR